MANACDICAHYEYDEDMESYVCTVNMDEDETASMMLRHRNGCPYFLLYDEYKMVQKQN